MSAANEKRERIDAASVRCAIYVRISLDREGAGLGVERQEKECRAYCERKGWRVVEVYVDNDVSATSSKPRPEWMRLVDDIKSGKLDAVVVWHVDRMTRKPRELEDVIDLAEQRGTQLGTVTGEIDLATPTGKMVARMLGAAARHEAEHKGERQRAQRMQAAEKGVPNSGGVRPFGYSDDRISVVIEEADLIRDAARRLLAGESLRSIATDWNEREIKTVKGNRWSAQAIKQIMTNARISGRREIGHRRAALGTIVHDSAWEPIVDVETSDRLRVLLTQSARRTNGGSTHRRYLLSGLLVCGKCGHKLHSLSEKGSRRAAYRCPASTQSSRASAEQPSCGGVTVAMKYAEPTVVADLLAAIESPELVERLHKREELDPAVVAQIVTDEQELIEIARDKSDGTITRAEWLAQREVVQQRLELNKRLVAKSTRTEALTLLDGDDEIEERWERLNLSQQRAIIGEVFAEISVMPAQGRGLKFNPDRIKASWRF